MKNTTEPITVQTTIKASKEKIWKLWTTPVDIMKWNNPSEDWHTILVENDLKVNGKFLFRMKSKNGSEGFDFCGQYDSIIPFEQIEYTLADGRKTINKFLVNGSETTILETFDPEKETPREIQKDFCQGVLNNFKRFVEGQ